MLAVISIAFVWWKLFYWMRLFPRTAFFVNLVTETIYYMGPFTLFLGLLVMALSNLIYILANVDHKSEFL